MIIPRDTLDPKHRFDMILASACCTGNIESVMRLIADGRSITFCDYAVIKAAAEGGQIEVIEYFIKHHGFKLCNIAQAVLLGACVESQSNVVSWLINKDAVKYATDQDWFLYACAGGNTEIISTLISYVDDINMCEGAPLTTAIVNNHLDAVKVLLDNKADPTLITNEVMDIAGHRCSIAMLDFLFEVGNNL